MQFYQHDTVFYLARHLLWSMSVRLSVTSQLYCIKTAEKIETGFLAQVFPSAYPSLCYERICVILKNEGVSL